MFIAALTTIAKTWKQPKRPWTDEGVKKTWYIRNATHPQKERNNASGETESSQSERERQTPYDITYTFTNELILQNRNRLTDTETRLAADGEWEFGMSRYKLVYVGWIPNKVLWYSTGGCMQYLVINHNGKEYENECKHAYN